MITTGQEGYIEEHAYVPEHIFQYVTAISQAEPFLLGDFLAYTRKDHLIFIGYPLKEAFQEKQMRKGLEDAIKRFKPEIVALTTPSIPPSVNDCGHSPSDYYYSIDLSALSISQKVRHMLNRAGRELSVERNRNFDEEHRKMVDNFLRTHPVDEETRFIFQRIDKYLSSSKTAWIFDARNNAGELVAFDVAEFWARCYTICMFNFSSDALYVPGSSDLLLSEVIQQSQREGKKYINLGLGINPGATFFKKKWGGRVFLPYSFCLYHPSGKEILDILLPRL
jgi:hypothetical protein